MEVIMKTKKVRSSVDAEFLQSEEARIINSVLPPFNLTYEGLEYQEFSPVEGEEDNWWDSCFESRSNRRSK
jgi:hypothetical protein